MRQFLGGVQSKKPICEKKREKREKRKKKKKKKKLLKRKERKREKFENDLGKEILRKKEKKTLNKKRSLNFRIEYPQNYALNDNFLASSIPVGLNPEFYKQILILDKPE